MKENNFRIIELPENQVLLTKDFEQEEDTEDSILLTVTFFLDGIKVVNSLGYESEENRDKLFNAFTEEMAQAFINQSMNMLCVPKMNKV